MYAASGVGKTRFGADLLTILLRKVETDPELMERILRHELANPEDELKQMKKLIQTGKWVYVDFSDGDMPDFTSITTDTILWLILLKLISPATKFSYTQAPEHKRTILWNLLQCELQASPTTPVLLELHIDEFQKAFSQSDLQTYLTHKTKLLFRQFCNKLMQVVMYAAQYGIFILPLLTGTLNINYLGIFPPTDFAAISILLQPENNEATRTAFLNQLQPVICTQFKSNIGLLQLLDTTGGVWGMYEALNRAIGEMRLDEQKNLQQNLSILWNTFCEKVEGYYPPSIVTQAKQLVEYTLAGVQVNLYSTIENVEVGMLMYNGCVVLSKTKSSDEYLITLPFVLIVLLCTAFNLDLLRKENFCTPLLPQEFEKFVFCIKTNTFSSLEIEKPKVKRQKKDVATKGPAKIMC